MEEIWGDIEGYEGLYQVSNLGRVKSLRGKEEKILKAGVGTSGYNFVGLRKSGNVSYKQVHRLVALAFIPNIYNMPQVNHKDKNRLNNVVDNLEWCTAQYNIDYSNSKSIIQYDLQGNYIRTWKSSKEIEKETKIDHSNIIRCCRGEIKKSHKYLWRYAEESQKIAS